MERKWKQGGVGIVCASPTTNKNKAKRRQSGFSMLSSPIDSKIKRRKSVVKQDLEFNR